MASTDEKRVMVVGLDGATFDVIRPLADCGELPTIGSLMRDGISMPLLSTTPPITPPAWSSFATGVAPQQHGVFGFNYPSQKDRGLRLTSSADLRAPTLWERLGAAGRRCLLIDVPFTFPPQPIEGVNVAGFPLSESATYTHPIDLVARLDAGGVSCERHPNEAPDPTTPAFLDWIDRFNDSRLRLFDYLTKADSWQFAMVGTMAIDWAQHAVWKYYDPRFVFASEPEAEGWRETLFEVYRCVDRYIARLIEAAGDGATTILVSDHGFGTSFHYDYVSQALKDAGLLTFQTDRGGIASRIGKAALKAARSSPRLQRVGKCLLGDASKARSWARRGRSYSQIDWQRTRVFPAGDYNLNLYVNASRRFAGGIVSDDEYVSTVDRAIESLQSFRPPGHDLPLVRKIVRNSARAGEEAEVTIPDLSLELTVLPPIDPKGPVASAAGILGFHKPEGILISSSGEWLPDSSRTEMQITEIAPVLLRWFGIEDKPVSAGRKAKKAAYSTEDSEAVFDRLRDLGYMD